MAASQTVHPGASLAQTATLDGATYLGSMTWAALQASEYANGSVGLAALDADAQVFITDWRVPMSPSADGTYWTSPHAITIEQHGAATGSDLVYTATGTSSSGVASASAGAKTRVTITGHGLTAGNDGVSVYVSAGTNWQVGLYPYTYVDANNIDLSVTWNAAFGNPTVRTATGGLLYTQIRSVAIPAKLMQANSCIMVYSHWQFTSSANGRYMFLRHNTNDLFQVTTANQSGYADTRMIRNRGAKNSQISQATGAATWNVGQSPRTASIDTDAAHTINFGGDLRVANEFMRIAGYTVEVKI
jgi:hypothetical protein